MRRTYPTFPERPVPKRRIRLVLKKISRQKNTRPPIHVCRGRIFAVNRPGRANGIAASHGIPNIRAGLGAGVQTGHEGQTGSTAVNQLRSRGVREIARTECLGTLSIIDKRVHADSASFYHRTYHCRRAHIGRSSRSCETNHPSRPRSKPCFIGSTAS